MIEVVDLVCLGQAPCNEQALANVFLVEQDIGSIAIELAFCCLLPDFAHVYEVAIEHVLEDAIFVFQILLSHEILCSIDELILANVLGDNTNQNL